MFYVYFCCETCSEDSGAGRGDLQAVIRFQARHEGHETRISALGYGGMSLRSYIEYQQEQIRKYHHPVRKLIRFITREDYRYGEHRADLGGTVRSPELPGQRSRLKSVASELGNWLE